MLLLASLAFATHVKTFEIDPSYTKGRFAGLESLVVDPATTTVAPVATTPKGNIIANGVPAGDPALVFTNPLSSWGWVEINGTRIGTIGPYATMRLEGLKPGWYGVIVEVNTGYRAPYAIDVK